MATAIAKFDNEVVNILEKLINPFEKRKKIQIDDEAFHNFKEIITKMKNATSSKKWEFFFG